MRLTSRGGKPTFSSERQGVLRAREVNLERFFEGRVEYVAPSFQRPYGWVQEVSGQVWAGLAARDGTETFLGALVSMDLGRLPDGTHKRLLIDGNQRLMTALAAAMAVRDRLAARAPAAAAHINTTCFLNGGAGTAQRFKSIVPRRDRGAFERLVLGEPLPAAHELGRAYGFFQDALAAEGAERLPELAERLLRVLTFVALELERDEDPYPIYKLLSAPGEAFTKRGLVEYTRFATDPELMAMIAGGESQEVEFKACTMRNDKLETSPWNVVRSVAGFMNSAAGGTLLIGIEDDGGVRGINEEYAAIDSGKANWDGYQLYLNNVLRGRLSVENPFLYYTVDRHRVSGRDVCVIRVRPADAPVYVDKHLFVRNGNQTIEMLGPDLVHYVATRWSGQQL